MKHHHYTEKELVKAYTTLVRPIAEYCAPVFHSMLTDAQDEKIERLQATALRYIFGFGISYAKMRERSGLQTLRQRRIELCDKFAQKARNNLRFAHWFPERVAGRRGRHHEEFHEMTARTDRLNNSPLFYFRRRLNGKEGKRYGERNRRYRENKEE